MTEYGELTATEQKWIDEITTDKWAAKKTLDVALSHYHNTMNQCRKDEREFWERVCERLGLNMYDGYKLARHNARTVIVPADSEDRE